MQTINPIFLNGTGIKATIGTRTVEPKPTRTGTERKTRSDKTEDIKFPVTPEQREQLRRAAIRRNLGNKQTKYNTMLLRAALQEPEKAAPVEYRDSGQYMHVKPQQIDHERIQELALKWGLSKRQTVHRLMINALGRIQP